MKLTVNGEPWDVDVDPATPLLNVLRNDLDLLGAKRGCAQEQCYACSVLIDGRTQPSCQIPVGQASELPITTVEAEELDPIREFFLVEQAGQCGFCIAGMVVATQGLLNQTRRPNDAQIREALDTNLCRCGVYDRIRRAIRFRIGEPEDPIWDVRTQPRLTETNEEPSPARNRSIAASPDVDSWLTINADQTVTIFTGKAELGQGIATALCGIAAEELSVDPARITMIGPDTARTPNEGVTSGSLSIEMSGTAIRAAARTARSVLLADAAAALDIVVGDLVVDDGVVTSPGLGRETTYWELRGDQPFEVPISPDLPPASDGNVEASSPERIDLAAKVAGLPSYVSDLRPAGTVHGRVLRPPRFDSTLIDIDTTSAQALGGVVSVVVDGSFIGVVAEREEQADAAVELLRDSASWTPSVPLPDPHVELLSGPTADYTVVDGIPIDHELSSPATDPDAGFDHAARYSKPFILHGSLGPSSALARFDDDALTVWSHTQGVFPLRGSLAEVLGLDEEQIRVIHTQGPGCYGHNGADDVALDAALLARSVPGRPVLLTWTRADEHRFEPWGPAMIVELRADLQGASIAAYDSENWSYTHTTRPQPSGNGSTTLLAGWHIASALTRPTPKPIQARHIGAHRNSDPLYTTGPRRIRTHLSTTTGYRTSALRALGAFTNVFAIESFVDELAAIAGQDAVDFRLANLDDERAALVIETAADEAEWSRPRPTDHGRGLGFARYKNQQTYCAVVVDVEVDRSTGIISVVHATAAADAGRIVSPDGLSNQLEGGCVQAASWTLKEAVQLESDRTVSEDWETYPVIRFSDSFPVSTILIDRPDQPSLGCGEAAQGPMAAAIANAVFDAIGVRLRDLPFTPDRLLDHL